MNNNDTVQPFTHPGAQQDTGASDNGVTAEEQTPSSKNTPSHAETLENVQADLQAQPDAQTNHESDADHAEQPARPAPKSGNAAGVTARRQSHPHQSSDGTCLALLSKTRLTSCT